MFLSLSRWVFLSVLICVCQALFFSQCGNDEFSDVDMISSDTTKRFNMFKRLCCGMWSSIAGGVVELLFVL